ncbi:ACT domain-containing protein [Stutzerimonas decontaminans]|uniref:ACT domain-containing protein n=2 Tax=Stutzerimonas TaxID=2901164 RepID=A0ABX4VWA5_9GAMM|nr:ACT domain-containing protein [Stutzerimonas decontaminans]AHY40958.1 amino acid-binding protein [Stutzerimonas decontaminans]MCQ4243489.1 ACT domain-containing protein [Stutzerimonas decontaminans]PNF84497.1 ACT domain-containing protein [Stutzerimonas decontaminans]
MTQSFSVLPQNFAIARLEPGAELPSAVLASPGFMSITRTEDELSIVCAVDVAAGLPRVDSSWRAIKVQGPFAFDQTGILASFLDPLAVAGVGIFAVSTFDTDYILVKSENLANAVAALKRAGHHLIGE